MAGDHPQLPRRSGRRQRLSPLHAGITKKQYPNRLGNGPITNVVAGWAGLVLAALLLYWARGSQHPAWSFASAALGVLLIGLFHAGPGAFGRSDAPR